MFPGDREAKDTNPTFYSCGLLFVIGSEQAKVIACLDICALGCGIKIAEPVSVK